MRIRKKKKRFGLHLPKSGSFAQRMLNSGIKIPTDDGAEMLLPFSMIVAGLFAPPKVEKMGTIVRGGLELIVVHWETFTVTGIERRWSVWRKGWKEFHYTAFAFAELLEKLDSDFDPNSEGEKQ